MLKFIKKNSYLFIALCSILWSLLSYTEDTNGKNTEYVFAAADNSLTTKKINEVKLRHLNKYRLQTDEKKRMSGTGSAFYVGNGIWFTARHVINKCKKVLINLNSTNRLIEKILIHPNSDLALFKFPTNPTPNKFNIAKDVSQYAFASGFPGGKPGDISLSLAGFMAMEERGYNILEKHSIFAVLEKYPKNLTSFGGISGGPSFDRFGKINGVVVAEFVRRGLIGAVGIKQISWLIAASKKEAYFSKDIDILNENYLKLNIDQDRFKQIGQKLRKDGNVTQLFCIA